MKSRSRPRAPTTVKRTVPLGRLPNVEYRTREYLTEREVERLMKAAGNTRTSRQTSSQVRLVPILLQKSAIIAARLPPRFLGTVLTIRSLQSAEAGALTHDIGYARHGSAAGGGRATSFASRRRFCAIAARVNSSCAPHGPRNRSRPSRKMRLR